MLAAAAAGLALLLALGGCTAAGADGASPGGLAGETRTITHMDGSEVVVPQSPQRLAAVYGPAYEALVALGAEEKIVVCADVQFENFPWARKIFSRIDELPYLVNVHSSVSTEELLRHSPDLAFTFARPNELRQLEKNGVAAVPGLTTGSLDEVKDFLFVYAEALGEEYLPAAEAYATYFDEKRAAVTAVTDAIPEQERPRVYYAGVDILTTYGRYSDLCELIGEAGGIAVSGELEAGNRTQVNFEQLAAWDPEVIFIDHGGMNEKESVEEVLNATYGNERYGAITAVAEREVYLSPSGVFYWDMGLQKILLLQYIAKTLHPDLFADLDMAAEVQEFHQTFFDYPLTREEAERILAREDP